MNGQLRRAVQEGARSHGLLNITALDFLSLSIPMPSLARQREIVAVLEAAKREQRAVADQLAALRLQKRALMQHLLRGKSLAPIQEE